MKSIAALAVLAAALQTACIAQVKSPITVSITTPSQVAKIGEAIRVNVTVKNTSDHSVKLYKALGPDGQAEAANQIEVLDVDGKKLPRIDGLAVQVRGQIYHRQMPMSRTMIRLDPGQSNEDFLILNNLFDLSKPGKYRVTVGHGLRVDVPGSDPEFNERTVETDHYHSNGVAIHVCESIPRDATAASGGCFPLSGLAATDRIKTQRRIALFEQACAGERAVTVFEMFLAAMLCDDQSAIAEQSGSGITQKAQRGRIFPRQVVRRIEKDHFVAFSL